MKFNFALFIFCSYFVISSCAPNYVAYWERTEPIVGDKENLLEYSKFRVIRRGKERFINGTFIYKVDFDNTYNCKLTTAYSPYSNSQFIHQPYQVDPTPACDFFKHSYRRYGQPMFENKSDFPLIPETGLCPLPKGEYYVKDAQLIYDSFPWQLPKGLWKIELFFLNAAGESVGGYRLFLKFENKS